MEKQYNISIIGMGYVGTPLALAFSDYYPVIGYDIDPVRICELHNNFDRNLENKNFLVKNLTISNNLSDIQKSNIYIIAVPTPLTHNDQPDLSYIENATRSVAQFVCPGDIIIYESSFYPGLTEEFCVPILEAGSNLIFNLDFFCGYSPERISPGTDKNALCNIVKITSGSNTNIAKEIDQLYSKIIKAGTLMVPSIKIAEASKLIENTQRDVNIAFINEVCMMLDKMEIDSSQVLNAARTKWNFLNFEPGLVGGECIGVSPHYLAHQAKKFNYRAELILQSRKINNKIIDFIIFKVKQILSSHISKSNKIKLLVLGYTYKENCPDSRNTRVNDLIHGLNEISNHIDVYDPYIDNTFNTNFVKNPFLSNKKYDAIIVTVAHNEFKLYSKSDFQSISNGKLVLLDIKGIYEYSTWKL